MILKNKILPLAFLAIILLSCQKGGQVSEVGNQAPSFSLPGLDGNIVKLESLRGKVVILNFWIYTWGACVADLPRLAELYRSYSSDGLEILAICLDENEDRILSTVSRFNLNYRILIDKGTTTTGAYKVRSIPLNLIIDKKGVIRYRQVGYNPDVMREVIEQLL